jgi:hypothetical protein
MVVECSGAAGTRDTRHGHARMSSISNMVRFEDQPQNHSVVVILHCASQRAAGPVEQKMEIQAGKLASWHKADLMH